MRGFKEGMKGANETADADAAAAPAQQVTASKRADSGNTVDVEAKTKS